MLMLTKVTLRSCTITTFLRRATTFGQTTVAILTSFSLVRRLHHPRQNGQLKFTTLCAEMMERFTHFSTIQIGQSMVHQVKNAFMSLFFFCCALETTDSLSFL